MDERWVQIICREAHVSVSHALSGYVRGMIEPIPDFDPDVDDWLARLWKTT